MMQSLLNECLSGKRKLLCPVAGSGLNAKVAADSGADAIFALNAGVYRNHGVGSLAAYQPYGNAFKQTQQLLEDVLPKINGLPVIAGLAPHDPHLSLQERLDIYRSIGVQAITNWPALGMTDGNLRAIYEDSGWTPEEELRLLREAKKAGFSTFAFVFAKDEAKKFIKAGADALVINMGLTHEVTHLEDHRNRFNAALHRYRAIRAEVRASKKRPVCLCFGGPFTLIEHFEWLKQQAQFDGIAGGSLFERIPIESVLGTGFHQFRQLLDAKAESRQPEGLGPIIGKSAPMQELFQLIKKVTPHDVHVCIEGESGTGKELVAQQIHLLSKRQAKPFVTMNCGAIPESLIESEFFGHERGAFTGADRQRPGKFELAHEGSLFLDEVADLTPRGQVALLRAIQQQEIMRIGGSHTIQVDVRIISATNRRLRELVNKGQFREDLYYRLCNIHLEVPPLRERSGDIPLLANRLLMRYAIQFQVKRSQIEPSFMKQLESYEWPGNVRELEHVISQAMLLEEDPERLRGSRFSPETGFIAAREKHWHQLDRSQRQTAVIDAMRKYDGNKSKAASSLGITRRTLYKWLPNSQLTS